MSNYRLSVPASVKRGEAIRIRLIIQHPMETGFRLDAAARPIPKNTIREIVCRYGGEEVLRMELSSGITANPYFEFAARADATGEIVVDWIDDLDVKGQARAMVTVTE
jgi:sulfur-oxidizing protein SoxZ